MGAAAEGMGITRRQGLPTLCSSVAKLNSKEVFTWIHPQM
jgi:hypothetical protein